MEERSQGNNKQNEEFKENHDYIQNEECIETYNNKQIKTKIDYDDLVSSAGEIGLYQLLIFLSPLPFYGFGAFAYFSQLFMTAVSPNHWCWIPELDNLTDIERRSLAIPKDENQRYGYSNCIEYVANWTTVLDSGQKPNTSWPTQQCRFGWEFNNSEIPYPTIASEMEWVCDKNSYQAVAQSIFFMGSIFGGFLIGWLSDRYGRIPALVCSNLIGGVAGLASIFATNFIEFSVCRFFMGMSFDNCMAMIFLLILELVSPRYRNIIANLSTGISYTIGLVALPWVAKACGHWKILGAATSIPMALSVLLLFFMPESPRWLLSKGRIEDAIEKIKQMGRINKKEIPEDIIHEFRMNANCKKLEPEKNSTLIELCKKPLLRWVLICICIDFMCSSIVFDALVRSLDSVSFDFFISFTLVSFTELPALLIVSFALDNTGRKWLSIFVMSMCCVFSFLSSLIGNGLPSLICAIVARFGVNVSYMVAVQWAAELLPTPVRGAGASFVHICGFIATVLSPYIVYTENYIPGLPLMLVGVISAIGAASMLYLPETAGKSMPQTFEEAEDLVKNKKFFDIPFLRKKDK